MKSLMIGAAVLAMSAALFGAEERLIQFDLAKAGSFWSKTKSFATVEKASDQLLVTTLKPTKAAYVQVGAMVRKGLKPGKYRVDFQLKSSVDFLGEASVRLAYKPMSVIGTQPVELKAGETKAFSCSFEVDEKTKKLPLLTPVIAVGKQPADATFLLCDAVLNKITE